jgi:hypothetical protein
VPKGLHKPAHRTIIVQFCSSKTRQVSTKKGRPLFDGGSKITAVVSCRFQKLACSILPSCGGSGFSNLPVRLCRTTYSCAQTERSLTGHAFHFQTRSVPMLSTEHGLRCAHALSMRLATAGVCAEYVPNIDSHSPDRPVATDVPRKRVPRRLSRNHRNRLITIHRP